MTSFRDYPQGNRDIQDMLERHVYADMEHVEGAGSVVRIKGTGTEDQEVPTIQTGYGFRLKADTDAEVLVFGGGSDTNLKFALVQIPHAKQRQWEEGRSGIQNVNDPDHAIEFRDGACYLTKGTFTTADGTIEVQNGRVIIRGSATITGPLTVNGGVTAPVYNIGTDPNVPPPTP